MPAPRLNKSPSTINQQPPTTPPPTNLEMQPLPEASPDLPPETIPQQQPLAKQLTLRLYTSHFLSTWNSRLFEFGAVLFLASIFPDTLLPMSMYALIRSGVAILLAQSVGAWIDRGNRLTVIRASIVGQRVAVAVSCGVFWVLEGKKGSLVGEVRNGLFGVVVVLACLEKVGAMMNLVAVERDWVGVPRLDGFVERALMGARLLLLRKGTSTRGEVRISSGNRCRDFG